MDHLGQLLHIIRHAQRYLLGSSIMDLPAGCAHMEGWGLPGEPPCRMCQYGSWGVYHLTTTRKRAECGQDKKTIVNILLRGSEDIKEVIMVTNELEGWGGD